MESKRSHYKPYNQLSRQQRWRRKKIAAVSHNSKGGQQINISVNYKEIAEPGRKITGKSMNSKNRSKLLSLLVTRSAAEASSAISKCNSAQSSLLLRSTDNHQSTFLDNFLINREHETRTITDIIRDWALAERNVPRSAITNLLKVLQPLHSSLPLSAETLISRPSLTFENMVEEGAYVYFANWTTTLREFLQNCWKSDKPYTLLINIDGLPLFKSSPNYKLYPVLVMVKGVASRPICAAIYCTMKSANREMPCPSILFKDFVEDLKKLNQTSIKIGKNEIKMVKMGVFVCDAPARASLKCIKGHSGYSSCERCEAIGEYHGGHVCLPHTSAALRTDFAFVAQSDVYHHTGVSLLSEIGVKMVSDFILDYMHLVCLGVMRRLMLWWRGVRRYIAYITHCV